MAPESLSQLLVDVRGGVYSDLDAGRGPRSDPEATLGFQIIPARTRGDYPSEVVYNQRELPTCGDKPSESRGSKMRRALLSNSTWCVLLTGIVDWPPASLAARGPRILVRIFGRPIHAHDMTLLGVRHPVGLSHSGHHAGSQSARGGRQKVGKGTGGLGCLSFDDWLRSTQRGFPDALQRTGGPVYARTYLQSRIPASRPR